MIGLVVSIALAASILVQTKLQNDVQTKDTSQLVKSYQKILNTENSTAIQSNEPVSISKAAIIDQLDRGIPNKPFEQKAQQYLVQSGYQVDLFTTEDITVDFYKNLPSMNYKFIIIRAHGLQDQPNNETMLFTGERYNLTKHFSEQLVHQVGIGIPLTIQEVGMLKPKNETEQQFFAENKYFTIGAKFVDEVMVGQFPNSIIVIGGCDALGNQDLAKSLIYRGASKIVGWPKTITSDENDAVMVAFLDKVLQNKTDVTQAVIQINQEYGHYMGFPALLNVISRG